MSLLARLNGPDAPPGTVAPFAERIGRWLHWTDAATLHEVLEGPAPAAAHTVAPIDAETYARDLRQLRDTIARAIEVDCAAAARDAEDGDPKAWRRTVARRLQSIQTNVGPMRERLRAALAARSPSCARLAQVDAVMARTLGPQERALMAAMLPSSLQRHADRLRTRAATPDAWQAPFHRELQAVLTAALDLSLQPLEGLLAALCAASPDTRR